jgi:hypothetical protein
MDRKRLRGSPTLVVALCALVLAAAGTAVAGPASLERALTKSKVKSIAGKVANKAISKRAPAFAQVDRFGVVDAANSSGIGQANVVAGSVGGYYCFRNLGFAPRGGSATVDWNSSPDLVPTIGLGGNTDCPAGTEFFVDMRKLDETGSATGGFFVTIYR